MINLSKFDFISSVISLIYSEEYISSIANMSVSLNVPIQYMRKTMFTFLSNLVLQSCLNVMNENSENETTLVEAYLDNPDDLKKRFHNGELDNVIWIIDLRVLDNNENQLLPLTQLEFSALKSHGESILSLKHAAIFETKNTINPVSRKIQEYIETIQHAIDLKKQVTFNYSTYNTELKKHETTIKTCFPQNLITNISDNWFYMQSTELKLYRLDRINTFCRIEKLSPKFPGAAEEPNRKYIWGAYSTPQDIPTHVKLRINPNTGNIISKIDNDTALRKNTRQFYKFGDYYYYEDDIIGLDELQRWIRSYGSSIEVIEPESLRLNIVARAKETLALYEASNNWGNL